MELLHFLNDRLVAILDRYSLPGQHVGTDLAELISNSDTKELIIPVLGMQGMGKSTLINSLLKEDILPNEADETTCVPVEVKYGDKEEARVFFLGSESPAIVHTKAELYDYADNNLNPGNSKNVERIVLYRNNDLLRSGVTIVDLPGVGSLTKANEETTKRYIQNLCTALFVIPTVPTIRKTEAVFIKGVWTQFPTAIFVQNRWVGETQLAVDESVSFNTMRLKQIADQIHNPFDGKIIVINFYDAISGYLSKNNDQVEQSNIGELLAKLELISSKWEETFKESLKERFQNTLEYGKGRIEEKIASIDKTHEQLFEEKKCLLEQFEKETTDIKRLLKEAKKDLDDEQEEIEAFISDKTKEYSGKLRARTHQLIDKGLTDGERLTQAFYDYQEEESGSVYEAIVDRIGDLKISIEKKIERIVEAVNADISFAPSFVDFKKESAFKFEKVLEPVLDAGGAAGGALGGAAVAGIIGKSAILGSAAGPLGTAAGIAVGAAICVVVGVVARKGRKEITKKRGNGTKTEIEFSIMESESELKKAMRESFNDFFEEVYSSFDEILRTRKEQYEIMLEDLTHPVEDLDRASAREDLNYVVSVLDSIKQDC